jgi:hypothetical protein
MLIYHVSCYPIFGPDDTQGHVWEAAWAAHGAVLNAMEQGEFDWMD